MMIKFTQITEVYNVLHALDTYGRVWVREWNGKKEKFEWFLISSPTEENNEREDD